MSSNNKIKVRLQDGTVGVPDKFIVGKDEYETQSQAELAIKRQIIKDIQSWIENNTDLSDYWVIQEFTKSLYNIDRTNVLELIELLVQLT